LTADGKRALAHAEDPTYLDPLLIEGRKGVAGNPKEGEYGLRFGVSGAVHRPLDLERDVKHVLVDEKDYQALLDQYQAAVSKGEAPATIGGKPFQDFFKSSADLYNDFEIDAFRRTVPGFSERSPDEQRAVASLAGRLAASFPQEIPESTRRKLAAGLVTYTSVEKAAEVGVDAVADLKAYYHGTRAGEAIAKEGFRVGPRGLYGKGVYYSNPTVSMGYTYGGPSQVAQIVSGEVHVGKVATQTIDQFSADAFNQAAEYDSRRALRPDLINKDNGDYWVTRDPKRFGIKAITSYRPEHAQNMLPMLPDLLDAYAKNPDWASRYYLDKFDPKQLKGGLEQALGSGNPERRKAAGIVLAKQGHAKGMSMTLEALRKGQPERLRDAAGTAVLSGLGSLPTAESKLSAAKNLLTTDFYQAHERTVEESLRSTLGASAEPLIDEAKKRAGLGHRLGRWYRESLAPMFSPNAT
ncbi:MAG TPA: hypothetical protein V6D05_01850, partial [Stenomitos sp.]